MKKITKTVTAVFSAILICSTLFAEEKKDASEEKSPFSLKLTTDFAYYPESKCITGEDHFALQGVLGYQMPLPLTLAGLMFKAGGYYDGSVYKDYDKNFDGAFVTINISPLLQFQFGSKDNLTCLIDFSSRRSFDKEFTKAGESLLLTTKGREWFFNRLALSWTHTFF